MTSSETDMYYESIYKLVQILQREVSDPSAGKVVLMYKWSESIQIETDSSTCLTITVSKVTLDIICLTAFGE